VAQDAARFGGCALARAAGAAATFGIGDNLAACRIERRLDGKVTRPPAGARQCSHRFG
jgi:hypothetical protein